MHAQLSGHPHHWGLKAAESVHVRPPAWPWLRHLRTSPALLCVPEVPLPEAGKPSPTPEGLVGRLMPTIFL